MLMNLAEQSRCSEITYVPQSGEVHNFVREGCNVINGTVVGAAIGVAICPVPGAAEIGAAIGGWIGSKISQEPIQASD